MISWGDMGIYPTALSGFGICMGTTLGLGDFTNSYGHRMGTDMSKNSGETKGMGA